MSAPTTSPTGWLLVDGAAWRPLKEGEARRWGDRWFRPPGALRPVLCRSASAIQRAAAADRAGCNALPMRPETQRGPFPEPIYLHDLRPGRPTLGPLSAVFARARARGAVVPPAPPPGTAGDDLRKRREALGLTQRQVAESGGDAALSRGAIAEVERGTRPAGGVSGARYAGALARLEQKRGVTG